jgi:hypothetical protein
MTPILAKIEELISTFKQLMPTIYQQETLESTSLFNWLRFAGFPIMGLAQTRWQKNSTLCDFYQTDD